MKIEDRVRASFFEQAGYCEGLGSLFMRDLLEGLGRDLDHTTKTGAAVLSWPGDPEPKADALALRLAGGLHAIARSGAHPELAEYYDKPQQGSRGGLPAMLLDVLHRFDDQLHDWLSFAPQTNEVARSSVIFAGLCELTARFNLPVALYEMGCSAGLNLQCGEYGYRFGEAVYGNTNADLLLSPDWHGSPPPQVPVRVVARKGCDLNPLSVEDPNDAARLVAYLWPDQPERIMRVEKAITIARASPPVLTRATADDWIEQELLGSGEAGVTRVLFSTIAWNYFPKFARDRITGHVLEIGKAASPENPLAWMAFEFDDRDGGPFLTLQTWPGGGEREVLASADPHAYRIEWNK